MAASIDLTWPDLNDKGNFSVTKEGILHATDITFDGSMGGYSATEIDLPDGTTTFCFATEGKTAYGGTEEGFYLSEQGLGIGPGYYFQIQGNAKVNQVITLTRYTPSDIKLKNSINTLDLSDFFNSLKPVSFVYNYDEQNKNYIGFIANDVKNSVDSKYSLCSKNDNDYLTLDYKEFIALNTSEIQKLKKRAKELENFIYTYIEKKE